ncbi:MAG: hypothetical protein ABIH00_02380 [Armatimonadota bacterium]
MSWKSSEGSTQRLIQLCAGYWFFYVITGITVKYFLGKPDLGLPGMNGIQYLVYSTLGSTSIALLIIFALRWFKLETNKRITVGPFTFPYEFLYIIPSGICTAVVIPTTTLMYTLPISVMVAMIIMRASIIIISRLIDAVQIFQKILHKKVYWQEDVAVLFALIAAGINIFGVRSNGFEFVKNKAAVIILISYLLAYAIRLYIMNYFKNTRAPGVKQDNKGFFAVEQIAASSTLVVLSIVIFNSPKWLGWTADQVILFRDAIINPAPLWVWAVVAGTAFGIVAFFSVFLFLFKGRTATFAGLVNRLTSLVAGTTATLICAICFKMRFPNAKDWMSLFFILVAVAFLSFAEKKRVAELLAAHEIENSGASSK